MQQQTNRQILLVKRPVEIPDETCFKLVKSAIPEPINGQVLLQTRLLFMYYLSDFLY